MLDSFNQSIHNFVESFNIESFLQIMLVISAILFFTGIILRIICGHGSSLSRSVVAAMGILVIYVVAVAINIENHYEVFMTPLPFISLTGDYLSIFKLTGAELSAICSELVRMIVLAFLVNLADEIIPKGNTFLVKYFLSCLSVVVSMFAYWFVTGLLEQYLPGVIVTYAPVILIIIAVVLLMATVFKWIVGVVLGMTVNPIIGAIYTFFIGTFIGKKLFKAILTTLIMLVLVYICNVTGYTDILLVSSEIAAQLPTLAMICIVWILTILFL